MYYLFVTQFLLYSIYASFPYLGSLSNHTYLLHGDLMNVNIDNALCDSLMIMDVYLCVKYH